MNGLSRATARAVAASFALICTVAATSVPTTADKALQSSLPGALQAVVRLDMALTALPVGQDTETVAVKRLSEVVDTLPAPSDAGLRYMLLRLRVLRGAAREVAQWQAQWTALFEATLRDTAKNKDWYSKQLDGLKEAKLRAFSKYHGELYLTAASERVLTKGNILWDRLVELETMGGDVSLSSATATVRKFMQSYEATVRSELAQMKD
jgi:hypothetical protein